MQGHILLWAVVLRCVGHLLLALAAAFTTHPWASCVGAVGSLLLSAAHALDGR